MNPLVATESPVEGLWASTPGQEVTSSVICSLAVVVSLIGFSFGRRLLDHTTSSSELEVKPEI